MGDDAELLRDPAFQRLLVRRSRWRWGLSGLTIGAYFIWAIAGLYFAEAYGRPLPGTAIPGGIAVGLIIIVLSIVLSIVYVRIVNRLEAGEMSEQESQG